MYLLSFLPQLPPCSQWYAPTTRSSILCSSTPSPSSAFYSLLFCWCATKVAAPTRTKRARMVPLCCGSKSPIWVTLPHAWTPQPSASTLALWSKDDLTAPFLSPIYSLSHYFTYAFSLVPWQSLQKALWAPDLASSIHPYGWLNPSSAWCCHGYSDCQWKSPDIWFGCLFRGFLCYCCFHIPVSGHCSWTDIALSWAEVPVGLGAFIYLTHIVYAALAALVAYTSGWRKLLLCFVCSFECVVWTYFFSSLWSLVYTA